MRSILPLLLLISSALTGETDNYYSMNQNIKDSSELINEEFNRRLYNSLELINNRPDLQSVECSEIAGDLLKSFGVTLATGFESWIHQNNEIEKYPPAPLKRKKYFKKSIYYENTFNPLHRHLDFMIWTQFDPVINIGDVYIGTDKITHFTASGYLYYKRYLNALKNGLSREDAALKSIRKGITSEKLILGVTSNGIFSYADLESNYQGMQLGIDLCSGDDPLLNKSDGKWRLEGEIDLRNYVNPYWDESFYSCSGFHFKRKILQEKLMEYCPVFENEMIQNRFNFYMTDFEPSRNIEILDSLRIQGKIPDNHPYQLQLICTDSPKKP